MIVSYNASAVKMYNAVSGLVCFENKNIFLWRLNPGANPTTFEFRATYNADVVGSRLERFSKWNVIFFVLQNELGYTWRCKKLQRLCCKSKS
jgi:hypothetical protein